MVPLFLLVLLLIPFAVSAIDTGFEIPVEYAKVSADGIERYRKSDASVKVITTDGLAAVEASLEVRQLSHDFLFGCAFPSWDISKKQPSPENWAQFERYFLSLFNYTTTENMLKWPSLEKTEGQPDYAMTDALVEWCEKNKVKIKGHCLVWGHDNGGYPKWLTEYSPDEVATRVKKRVQTVVGHYKGKIDIWDVVNEPLHCHWFEEHMSDDYTVKALKWAREANPGAELLVNEYGCHWGEADRFVEYCRNVMKNQVAIDALGEQAHDSPTLYSPKNIWDTLNKLASWGRDIHITEITQPSNGTDIKSDFVQGKWTPEIQGKYYRYYYTMAFSHPNVKAITMWALWDGSSWLDQGGIIAKDWTPKPAYHELDHLINKEWRTNISGAVGNDGTFRFRGFHGEYEVKINLDGRTLTTRMHIKEGKRNSITIRIPDTVFNGRS